MSDDTARSLPRSVGVYFAVMQLVFTLGWTVYIIYLPAMATQVGIAPSAIVLILLLDQAIFTVADTAMGAAADRVAGIVGRLGPAVGILAATSCAAFVAMPFIVGQGPAAQSWFIAMIVIWAVTSSALRAPPLVLIGKYAAKPARPLLAALAMLGYGLAGVVSPFVGGWLRDVDVRLPFVISSAALLLTALALSKVEREMVTAAPSAATPPAPSKPFGTVQIAFIAAMLLLALGFQFHVSINSARLFLQFAGPGDLQWLTPLFWLGFNAALFPAAFLGKHHGPLVVIGWSGVIGAMALLGTFLATNLGLMVVAQVCAGAAWGFMLASAVTAAFSIGETGSEGKVVGLVFSAIALATFARMGVVAGNVNKMPDYAWLIQWMPLACWLVAGLTVLVLAISRLRLGARDVRPAVPGG